VGDIACQAITHHTAPPTTTQTTTPITTQTALPTTQTTSPTTAAISPSHEYSIGAFKWDLKRSLIMAGTACFIGAPFSYFININLERMFPGKSFGQIFKKMMGNWVASPVMISMTFVTVSLLKGKTIEQAQNKVVADVGPTLLTGLCYWPFVGFLNFRYVPVHYRPVVGSIAGAFWAIYMSNQTNKEVPSTIQVV